MLFHLSSLQPAVGNSSHKYTYMLSELPFKNNPFRTPDPLPTSPLSLPSVERCLHWFGHLIIPPLSLSPLHSGQDSPYLALVLRRLWGSPVLPYSVDIFPLLFIPPLKSIQHSHPLFAWKSFLSWHQTHHTLSWLSFLPITYLHFGLHCRSLVP